MISIEERVDLNADADAVFDFLSDFRNLPKWDPGIDYCHRTHGEGAAGTKYDVGVVFLGRKSSMRYETRRCDRSTRKAEIAGRGSGIKAVDRIRVERRGSGCTVVWQADFVLRGPALVDRLAKPVFIRLGKKAMDGLRRYAASNSFEPTKSSTRAHSA